MTNGLQAWEIKLHRRVIGQYLLQVIIRHTMPDQSPETILRGVPAADVNLQRGFVTVQSAGRLQVRVDNLPASLQPPSGRASRARCKRICPRNRRALRIAWLSRIFNCR
jgi:hypothetical protein